MATLHSTRVAGVVVGSIIVPGLAFEPGMPRSFDSPSRSASSPRVLSSAEVRRGLGRPPMVRGPAVVDLLSDLSGSMIGANDAKGLRHEAALIALEHLATGRGSQWHARVFSFDMNSPLDLALTPLDGRGRQAAQRALLSASPGGSSNLGPSLRAAEATAPSMPRLLVVMSDFELFDMDLSSVYNLLANSTATHVLALVFTSDPPSALVATGVEVHHIHASNKPADVARFITDAAAKLAPASEPDSPAPARRLHLVSRRAARPT
jgi:hypothetical protein